MNILTSDATFSFQLIYLTRNSCPIWKGKSLQCLKWKKKKKPSIKLIIFTNFINSSYGIYRCRAVKFLAKVNGPISIHNFFEISLCIGTQPIFRKFFSQTRAKGGGELMYLKAFNLTATRSRERKLRFLTQTEDYFAVARSVHLLKNQIPKKEKDDV